MSESQGGSAPATPLLIEDGDAEPVDSHIDTAVPTRKPAYNLLARVLHWLMAVLIIAMLFLGAAMIGTMGNYGVLLSIHRTVGLAILVLALVRVANRLLRRGPAPGADLSCGERLAAVTSEAVLYVLFLLQPLVGWALVSSSGIPVRIAGDVYLPAIAPENAHLYARLHFAHTWLAYALLALFTAHMCAVLWHAVVLRDGLLRRMLWSPERTSCDPPAGASEPDAA